MKQANTSQPHRVFEIFTQQATEKKDSLGNHDNEFNFM